MAIGYSSVQFYLPVKGSSDAGIIILFDLFFFLIQLENWVLN